MDYIKKIVNLVGMTNMSSNLSGLEASTRLKKFKQISNSLRLHERLLSVIKVLLQE